MATLQSLTDVTAPSAERVSTIPGTVVLSVMTAPTKRNETLNARGGGLRLSGVWPVQSLVHHYPVWHATIMWTKSWAWSSCAVDSCTL